jgi:hypothetical protein
MAQEGNILARDRLPKRLHLTLGQLRLCLHDRDGSRWESSNLVAKSCNLFFRDTGMTECLSGLDLVNANARKADWKRNLCFEFLSFGSELEIVKIVPAIDNLEGVFYCAPGLNLVRLQQAGAATDHLPEFGVAEDGLSEDKIDDLPNVNACIKHVNADGNARHVVARELIEQSALTINSGVVGHHYFGELTLVFRVKRIKDSLNSPGMSHRHAEEDGFARQNAIRVLDRLLHELLHDEGVRGVIGDSLFKIAAFKIDFFNLFAFEDELLLIVETDRALAYTFFLKLRLDLEDAKIAEVRGNVVDSLIVRECESGQSILTLKKGKGVVIYNISWRGCKTEFDGVEIVEHFAVSVVNGTVALIDDNEIEEMWRERVGFVVDDIEHCRVCGDIDASICGGRPFAKFRPPRFVRDMLLEGVKRLFT